MAVNMVVNMVLDRIVSTLIEKCQTAVPATELSYVDVVKKGLLQSSKTVKNVQFGVSGGDHEIPDYMDGIATAKQFEEDAGFVLPYAREIGGGVMWFRRGVVRIEAFFIRERLTEDVAHEAAYEVLGRVISALDDMSVNGLSDDYGERAIRMFCTGNTYFESGGPPKSYIFRGKVLWSCLTERP